MQIDGMRAFLSTIVPRTPLNGMADTRNRVFPPASSALPTLEPRKQPGYDLLVLSDLGKKLNLNRRESSSLLEGRKADSVDSLPSWAQPMDKALSQTINILERMQKLAVAAQDKKLTDLDRIEMQIEIEDLKSNLKVVPRNLRGASPLSPDGKILLLEGPHPLGDYSSALERARDRILNGQEWDVREAWCADGFDRIIQNENGEDVWEVFAGNAWHVVDDRNVLTRREGEYVDSGIKVPTLRERLEWASPVVVMDAQSAARGVGYLEERIASVRKFREQLPNLIKQPRDPLEETCAFLEPLLSDFKESLASPDIAGYYLFSDGIYDYQYVTRRIMEGDDSDPSLVDRRNLEDKTSPKGRTDKSDSVAQGLSVPKLSEEGITLHNVKAIQVQGFSKQKE